MKKLLKALCVAWVIFAVGTMFGMGFMWGTRFMLQIM